MTMRIEIISVGTELLEGKANSDLTRLGDDIYKSGLDVAKAVVVGDSRPETEKAVKDALASADVVIITGGLGPTFDDITVSAVAAALGRTTYLDPAVLEKIKQRFAKRNLEYNPAANDSQARIISGARPVDNPHGTAPGQIIEIAGKPPKILALLPGPPREMRAVYENGIAPILRARAATLRKNLTLRICGLSESAVDAKIRRIVENESVTDKGLLKFTILCHQGIVDIKITAAESDELLLDEMLHNVRAEFYKALGDNIFGENTDTLESVVGRLLMKNKMTLAVAESCTAGLISARITNIPGSSFYFREGFAVYSNESKIKRLGVNPATIEKHGSVSRETTAELLDGLKKNASAHCGIAVTGYAGPVGAGGKESGLVYIGVFTPLETAVAEYRFSGSRGDVRERAVISSLDMLRKFLLRIK